MFLFQTRIRKETFIVLALYSLRSVTSGLPTPIAAYSAPWVKRPKPNLPKLLHVQEKVLK